MPNRTVQNALLLAAFGGLLLGSPVNAEAAGLALPLADSDGCEVTAAAAGLFVLAFPAVGANGLFQIPASTGEPHVVIPCVEFDRSAYLEGQNWGVSSP